MSLSEERLREIAANLPPADADLSRRERDAHDLLAEVKRLRAGIEEAASDLHVLAHTTACTGSMCDGCQAGRIQYRLTALLNPTGGETHE